MRLMVSLLCALMLSAGAAIAVAADEQALPTLTGRVVDQAELLGPGAEQQLTQMLAAHEQASSEQVVVVTVPSLQGQSIEQYGVELGRAWGIGQKGEDNGALLIVARDDRKIRIEVGYGLEGRLTDAQSSTIINGIMTPAFREGQFEQGIVQGAAAMIQVLGGNPLAVAERAEKKEKKPAGALILVLIMIGASMLGGGGRGGRGGTGRALLAGALLGGLAGGSRGGGGGGDSGGGGNGGGPGVVVVPPVVSPEVPGGIGVGVPVIGPGVIGGGTGGTGGGGIGSGVPVAGTMPDPSTYIVPSTANYGTDERFKDLAPTFDVSKAAMPIFNRNDPAPSIPPVSAGQPLPEGYKIIKGQVYQDPNVYAETDAGVVGTQLALNPVGSPPTSLLAEGGIVSLAGGGTPKGQGITPDFMVDTYYPSLIPKALDGNKAARNALLEAHSNFDNFTLPEELLLRIKYSSFQHGGVAERGYSHDGIGTLNATARNMFRPMVS